MAITFFNFALIVAGAVLGIVYLAHRLNKESESFIKDLRFTLKHRIIAHNRAKAKLSILDTRFRLLQKENKSLKADLSKFQQSSTELQLSGDIKEKLSTYLDEVNGLSEKLDQTKKEFSAQIQAQACHPERKSTSS